MMQGREPDILEEAIDWMIRLQDNPADERLQSAFQSWLNADAEHMKAWSQLQQTRQLVRSAESHLASQSKAISSDRSGQRSPLQRRMALAASIAAAILLVYLSPSAWLYLQADHMTGTGATEQITLPDGSTVILGGDSAIAVKFGDQARDVKLLSGAAFFNVRSLSAKPFNVEFGNARTTVLGTAFEVRLSSGAGSVAVEEGKVRVAHVSKSDEARSRLKALEAGTAVRIDRNGNAQFRAVALARIASWRRGKLIVENRPAGDVIDELERYYGGVVVSAGAGFRTNKISGIFDLTKPQDAILTAAKTAGAKAYTVSPWVLAIRD